MDGKFEAISSSAMQDVHTEVWQWRECEGYSSEIGTICAPVCESNIVERMKSCVTLVTSLSSNQCDIHVGIRQLCGGWSGGFKSAGAGWPVWDWRPV